MSKINVYLLHKPLEVEVVRLVDDPVWVAAQSPAGDGSHQGLLLRQTVDQERHNLREVRAHCIHTTCMKDEQVEGKVNKSLHTPSTWTYSETSL